MKKKRYLILIFLIVIIVIINYCFSSYEISYDLKSFNIKIDFKKDVYSFEIKEKRHFYFQLYSKRKINRKLISSIDIFEKGEYYCIYPKIKKLKTFPLCYKGNKSISFHLIDDEDILKFANINQKEESLLYQDSNILNVYNKPDKNTYIALWKYNGIYLLNHKNLEEIKLFNKDSYNNNLSILKGNKLLLPNYNEEHVFKKFIVFNLKTNKIKEIDTKYEIDYDSYIAGAYKDNVYLFDNKYFNLYEINLKKYEVKLIADEKQGYVKIEHGKFVSATKNEYVKEKTTYFDINHSSYFIKNNQLYKKNKDIDTLLFDGEEIKIIKEFKDKLYFVSKENLYEYSQYNGVVKILSYFELNFNNNLVYIYNQ